MSAPALTQYVQGQGAVSADGLNTFLQTCDTIAQLRSFIGTAGIQVYVRGTATEATLALSAVSRARRRDRTARRRRISSTA